MHQPTSMRWQRPAAVLLVSLFFAASRSGIRDAAERGRTMPAAGLAPRKSKAAGDAAAFDGTMKRDRGPQPFTRLAIASPKLCVLPRPPRSGVTRSWSLAMVSRMALRRRVPLSTIPR